MYLDVFVSCLRGTKFTTLIGSTSPQMRRTPERGDTRRHDDGYLDQDNVKKEEEKGNREYICLLRVRVRFGCLLSGFPIFR